MNKYIKFANLFNSRALYLVHFCNIWNLIRFITNKFAQISDQILYRKIDTRFARPLGQRAT